LKQLRTRDDDQDARTSAGTVSIDPLAQKLPEKRSIILTALERFRVQLGALSPLQSLHQTLPIDSANA